MYKNTNTVSYEIKYNQNIDEKVSLCFSFSNLDAYLIEENEKKYLVSALTENNKRMLELYKKLWSRIKKQSKKTNSVETFKYKNDFMKIRVDSNDHLPLTKILYIPILDIIVKSVFQIENEYSLQTHIEQCEYEREK